MRVVVAEDVMLTREGITRLLNDAGVDVVGEAEDADTLLRLVDEHDPAGVLVLSQYAIRLLEDHPQHVGYLLKERVFDVVVLLG